MKKLILAIVMMAGISIANAQTKGTNTVGAGIGFQSHKSESNQSVVNQDDSFFSLGYGRFFKENERIGLELSYGESERSGSQDLYINSGKNYGGKLSYQKYYPLLKKFYAFGGGRAGYNYGKSNVENNSYNDFYTSNSYSVGGYGGITWFLSKTFAFEADLLSADMNYNRTKRNGDNSNNTFTDTRTSFNLSTAGAINNLGFKIYLLF